MREQYIKWCKLTKRSRGILVHGSIKEFFDWLRSEGYELRKVSPGLAIATAIITIKNKLDKKTQ